MSTGPAASGAQERLRSAPCGGVRAPQTGRRAPNRSRGLDRPRAACTYMTPATRPPSSVARAVAHFALLRACGGGRLHTCMPLLSVSSVAPKRSWRRRATTAPGAGASAGSSTAPGSAVCSRGGMRPAASASPTRAATARSSSALTCWDLCKAQFKVRSRAGLSEAPPRVPVQCAASGRCHRSRPACPKHQCCSTAGAAGGGGGGGGGGGPQLWGGA